MIFVGNFVANFVEREHLAIHSVFDEVPAKVRDEGMGGKRAGIRGSPAAGRCG